MEILKGILTILIVAAAGIALYFVAMLVIGLVFAFFRFVGRSVTRLFGKEEVS